MRDRARCIMSARVTTPADTLRIAPFHDDLADAFDRLNRAWLVEGGFLEPADETYLAAPRATIVDRGGEIFFAIENGRVLGTAAAIRLDGQAFELAKVGVTPEAKGRGLGRRLVVCAIDFARTHGATRVVLTSNSRLVPALALYRSLGFEDRPCPEGFGYVTADVYMELALVPNPSL